MLDVEESMLDVSPGEPRRAAHRYSRVRRTGAPCDHLEDHPARPVEQEPAPVCQACLREGTTLGRAAAVPRVRQRRLLRLLTAPPRHRPLPRDHAPGMESAEPGEDWRWCYVHHAHRLSRDVVAVRPAGGRRPVAPVVAQQAPSAPEAARLRGYGRFGGYGRYGWLCRCRGRGRDGRGRRDRRRLRHGGGGGGGGGGAVTSRNGGSLPACSIAPDAGDQSLPVGLVDRPVRSR